MDKSDVPLRVLNTSKVVGEMRYSNEAYVASVDICGYGYDVIRCVSYEGHVQTFGSVSEILP